MGSAATSLGQHPSPASPIHLAKPKFVQSSRYFRPLRKSTQLMRSQTHTTARRPVIQYGKRGAARRSSSIRYPDDEDEDDIVTEKVATVKATAPSHHSRNGSGTSASVVKPASIDSPHRNSNKAPRRSVVEVVILSPSSKRSSLPRSKGKQKIVEDTKGAGPTSILKKRKSRVELLASEGDDSATGSVESEDPLILSPSKRTRPTHSYARYGRVSTPDDNVGMLCLFHAGDTCSEYVISYS